MKQRPRSPIRYSTPVAENNSVASLKGLRPSQCHENDLAKIVLVHEPGIEALFGSLHYSGSLFEKPVNLGKARQDHQNFKEAMRRRGIHVLDVRELLEYGCDSNLKYRVQLENFALEILQYSLAENSLAKKEQLEDAQEDGDLSPISGRAKVKKIRKHFTEKALALSSQQEFLLSDEYKRTCLSALGVKDLVDIIMLRPTVQLTPSSFNTPMKLDTMNVKPLLNLTFQRDQQLVTNKGLVISNMGSDQRKNETKIMKYCFEKIGVHLLGAVQDPGTVEGGDFIPAGEDLCFIGTGLRTNQAAINQFLQNDWFGTRRVAVVRDLFDCDQQRMHLDTVFNVLSSRCCVMLETIMGADVLQRRLVTEYTRQEDGSYVVSRRDVEFTEYLAEEGFEIIPVTEAHQAEYGINFLNLGDDYILAVDEDTARTILQSGKFQGDIEVIDYSGMTTMYGSVHCCSQVLQRTPLVKNRYTAPEPKATTVAPATSTVGVKSPNVASSAMLILPSYLETPFSEEDTESEEAEKVEIKLKEMVNETPSLLTSKLSSNAIESSTIKNKRLEYSALHQRLLAHNIDVRFVVQYVMDMHVYGHFGAHLLSTHTASETKSKQPEAVFYPLRNTSRRSERNTLDLVSTLDSIYGNHVNKSMVETFESPKSTTPSLCGSADAVFDRKNKKCYVLNTQHGEQAAAEFLCSQILSSYELVMFTAAVRELAHTRQALFISSKLAIVCTPAVQEAKEITLMLKESGHEVLEITLEQASYNGASGFIELHDPVKNELVLFASTQAWQILTEAQRHQIQALYSKTCLEVVDITATEKTGGSLSSIITELFH